MNLNRKQQAAILALNALKELEQLQLAELRALRKNPICWINPFLEKRPKHDIETYLLNDILWENGNDYKNFCRMTIDKFEELLALVETTIKRENTPMRYAISSRVRLAISLRYIATGDSYRSLEFLARVSRKTISSFVPEVLHAIYEVLEPKYLKMPTRKAEWLQIEKDFNIIWDFPHVLGAIDGKHVRIKAPPHSGSDYYNYKGYFSVVLLGVVNAHSKFIYIDVGGNGRASDSIVFKNPPLCQDLKIGELNIPPPKELQGQQTKTPYFFIGDNIFGLDTNLMKGFNRNVELTTPQEIYNYRLSRTRLTVETAFGRVVTRFRIFHRPIEVSLNTCDLIVKTCCVLHNYLSQDISVASDLTRDQSTKRLPETITPITQQDMNTYKYSCRYRNNLCKYFVTAGDVPYQWSKISKKQTQ